MWFLQSPFAKGSDSGAAVTTLSHDRQSLVFGGTVASMFVVDRICDTAIGYFPPDTVPSVKVHTLCITDSLSEEILL
jgi:hypothetical protein